MTAETEGAAPDANKTKPAGPDAVAAAAPHEGFEGAAAAAVPADMKPMTAAQWARVQRVYELVKQEGDAECESAIADLLRELDQRRSTALLEACFIATEVAKIADDMADPFRAGVSQAVEEMIERLMNAGRLEFNDDALTAETEPQARPEKETSRSVADPEALRGARLASGETPSVPADGA